MVYGRTCVGMQAQEHLDGAEESGMMAWETADATIESLIERAYTLKLDAVDIHLSGLSRDPNYLRQIKGWCLRYGLSVASDTAG